MRRLRGDRMFRKVLVTVDRSPFAEAALARVSDVRAESVVILQVVEPVASILAREVPDLVFLDIVMPKIDGDRLFYYIRSHPRTSHIPIVIVSGTLAEDTGDFSGIAAATSVQQRGVRLTDATVNFLIRRRSSFQIERVARHDVESGVDA